MTAIDSSGKSSYAFSRVIPLAALSEHSGEVFCDKMPNRRLKQNALIALMCMLPALAGAQEKLIAGANVNMVSGTEYPGGDPFLQRQNEPSLAVSTRNPLHLLGGANDYRSVDIPGLTDGKAVGDSWHGIYMSLNGGGSWVSTLLPGYPQQGPTSSPLWGYDAGADPVIRAGTNGLFYYSGIVFDRGEGGKSATFVSRFMDLNNDPRNPDSFAKGPIRYIDTNIVAQDPGYDPGVPGSDALSDGFIDKPWIAVDIPRSQNPESQSTTLFVPLQGGGTIPQTIECGPLYSAYAQIKGEDTKDIDSRIKFSASYDCGKTFTPPIELDNLEQGVPDKTVNQGTSIAIDPSSGDVYVSWRQFNNVTLSCTRGSDFWERNPEVWPVERFMVGEVLYGKEQALGIMAGSQNGNPWRLARELIVAKLNIISGAHEDQDIVAGKIREADTWLFESGWVYEGGGGGNGNGKNKKGNEKANGNANDKANDKEKVNSSPAFALTSFLEEYNYGDGEVGPGNCANFDIGEDELPGTGAPDAIVAVRSQDFGKTFSKPVIVSELVPFDQGTTLYTFRANSYPTMTADDTGRIYFAWSTRKIPGEEEEFGDSRVVISTFNSNRDNWENPSDWGLGSGEEQPKPIDPRPIDEQISAERGHQIQPTLTFSRGKLLLVYLDFRQDRSGVFERYIADYFTPDTDPDPNADASEVPQYRHTVDVRTSQASPSDRPAFSSGESVLNSEQSTQLSRYFNLLLPNDQYDPNDPASIAQRREQIQYNPLNQPLFKGGTVPFIGDYIDVAASPPFIPDGNGGWAYDTAQVDSPVFHTAWSDNRDVKGPPDGDWTNYIPPTRGGLSVFDSTTPVQECVPGEPDRSGMRNQNIYTSRISQGIYAAVPENTKPLFTPESGLTTSFVVFIRYSNNTLVRGDDRQREFTVTLPDKPRGNPVAVSFDQFGFSERSKNVTIGDNSSVAITVYATSENGFGSGSYDPVDIIIQSDDGALRATARINPDPLNPPPLASAESFRSALVKGDNLNDYFNPETFDGDLIRRDDGSFIAFHDLDKDDPSLISGGTSLSGSQLDYLNAALLQLSLSNPDVFNPGIYNPGIYNPGIYNPGIYNPGIYNPGIYNPGIYNPGIYNPGIYNPGIYNPGIYNPGIYNSTITDANYIISNEGDAASAYNVNLRLDDPDFDTYSYQLIVSKIYTTPIAENCSLVETPVQEVLVNNTSPALNGNLLSTSSEDSFYLEPGEFAIVTLRAFPLVPEQDPGAPPPPPTPPANLDDLSLSVVPDAVDEVLVAIGETQPPPVIDASDILKASPLTITSPAVLPSGTGGVAYSYSLSATGGESPVVSRVWVKSPVSDNLPKGLSVTAAGEISGIPLEGGTFGFTVRVIDSTGYDDHDFTIQTTEPANLVVTGFDYTPTNPTTNDGIDFVVVVTNSGQESAAASELELSISGAAVLLTETFSVPVLAPGATHEVNFSPASGFSAGSYTLSATTDINGDVLESDEINNSNATGFTVFEPLQAAAYVSRPAGENIVGAAFPNLQLLAAGGSGAKTWSVQSGALPAGLTLSESGLISGTLSAAGNFTFTLLVEDDLFSAELPGSEQVVAPLLLVTTSPPDGTAGEVYPGYQLLSNGGFGPKLFSIVSGSLPTGLSLNANTGLISGTASTAGNFAFTVRVADVSQSNDAAMSIDIDAPVLPLIVTTATLGGNGGFGPIPLSCPAGTVSVGIAGRAGDDIDRVELRCRSVISVNPASLGVTEVSGGIAGAGGGGADFGAALSCASGSVLTGVRAAITAPGWVDTLGSRCTPFGGAPVDQGLVGNSTGTPVNTLDCPTGYAVTGMNVRFGLLLDQVQLVCTTFNFAP